MTNPGVPGTEPDDFEELRFHDDMKADSGRKVDVGGAGVHDKVAAALQIDVAIADMTGKRHNTAFSTLFYTALGQVRTGEDAQKLFAAVDRCGMNYEVGKMGNPAALCDSAGFLTDAIVAAMRISPAVALIHFEKHRGALKNAGYGPELTWEKTLLRKVWSAARELQNAGRPKEALTLLEAFQPHLDAERYKSEVFLIGLDIKKG
jgi:hypothetical protein